jgi:thioredoxin reductase
MYDVIVIGAGPAGLQAALTLGRMHRSALLLDSGEYRNGTVLHMHNVAANDGTPPAEFRATARAQLAEYADVEVRDARVESISGQQGAFTVTLAGGTVEARRIVLATGMADELPAIPGLQDLWGVGAFSCPFCDGHEHADKPIAVIGEAARAAHLIGLLGRIVSSITIFPAAGSFSDEDRASLEALGAMVAPAAPTSVARHGDTVTLTTAEGEASAAGIFVASVVSRQRAPFAEQLGLTMLPSGAIEIDDFGRTSLPGVSAAGDIAHRASLPGPMAAVALAVAAGQLAAVGHIQSLMAENV